MDELKIEKNTYDHQFIINAMPVNNFTLFPSLNWLIVFPPLEGHNMGLKVYTGAQIVWYHIKGIYCSIWYIFFCLNFSEKAITN